MKYRITTAFKDTFALIFGSILGITFSLLLYTYIVSLSNPIIIRDNPIEPIEAKAGESFEICRTIVYDRDVKIDLSRAMTRIGSEGGMHTISYPSFSIIRTKGASYICRNIELPDDMKEGIWTVHTYVTVHTTPWWKTNFETDSFKIKVSK